MSFASLGLFYRGTSRFALGAAAELSAESIPGCILQLYVWLISPEEAGTFALASIGISALTTGFTNAMIAFDMDVDVPHRKNRPTFYGYLPDDNGLRGQCFALMTLISALRNISRSVGVALQIASGGGTTLAAVIIGGEMTLYMAYKLLRGDFFYWVRLDER